MLASYSTLFTKLKVPEVTESFIQCFEDDHCDAIKQNKTKTPSSISVSEVQAIPEMSQLSHSNEA